MSVKCGRCSQYHESAQGVRECYQGGTPTVIKEAVLISSTGDCLSPKQVIMVGILMKKLNLEWTGTAPVEALAKWGDGRTLIWGLKKAESLQAHGQPWSPPANTAVSARPKEEPAEREHGPQTRVTLPDVPAGHYATPSLTGNNDLDFWRIDRPENGRWAGRTFVQRVIGGRPSTSVRGRTVREALEAIIKAGIENAGMKYAEEIGRCRKCNRHLTDEDSRSRGYGPDCWGMIQGKIA